MPDTTERFHKQPVDVATAKRHTRGNVAAGSQAMSRAQDIHVEETPFSAYGNTVESWIRYLNDSPRFRGEWAPNASPSYMIGDSVTFYSAFYHARVDNPVNSPVDHTQWAQDTDHVIFPIAWRAGVIFPSGYPVTNEVDGATNIYQTLNASGHATYEPGVTEGWEAHWSLLYAGPVSWARGDGGEVPRNRIAATHLGNWVASRFTRGGDTCTHDGHLWYWTQYGTASSTPEPGTAGAGDWVQIDGMPDATDGVTLEQVDARIRALTPPPVISRADAEAGQSQVTQSFTAQRIAQAIAALEFGRSDVVALMRGFALAATGAGDAGREVADLIEGASEANKLNYVTGLRNKPIIPGDAEIDGRVREFARVSATDAAAGRGIVALIAALTGNNRLSYGDLRDALTGAAIADLIEGAADGDKLDYATGLRGAPRQTRVLGSIDWGSPGPYSTDAERRTYQAATGGIGTSDLTVGRYYGFVRDTTAAAGGAEVNTDKDVHYVIWFKLAAAVPVIADLTVPDTSYVGSEGSAAMQGLWVPAAEHWRDEPDTTHTDINPVPKWLALGQDSSGTFVQRRQHADGALGTFTRRIHVIERGW